MQKSDTITLGFLRTACFKLGVLELLLWFLVVKPMWDPWQLNPKYFQERFFLNFHFFRGGWYRPFSAFSIRGRWLLKLISSKRIEQLSSTWAHFKEETQLFKMSPNWAQLLDSFRSNSPPKLMFFSAFSIERRWLPKLISPKLIEQLSSTWAHFKEQTTLFNMSPSWAQLPNSFRSNSPPKLMLLSGKKQIQLITPNWSRNSKNCLFGNHNAFGVWYYRGWNDILLKLRLMIDDWWTMIDELQNVE